MLARFPKTAGNDWDMRVTYATLVCYTFQEVTLPLRQKTSSIPSFANSPVVPFLGSVAYYCFCSSLVATLLKVIANVFSTSVILFLQLGFSCEVHTAHRLIVDGIHFDWCQFHTWWLGHPAANMYLNNSGPFFKLGKYKRTFSYLTGYLIGQ